MVKLEHFENHLHNISSNKWDELFSLLPIIRKTKKARKLVSQKTATFSYLNPEEIVDKTSKLIMQLKLTPIFDWTDWQFGKNVLEDENFNYTTLDKVTLCKLLTCIYRSNRFIEGYLIYCFENGTIENILTNLKKKLSKENQ